MPTLTNYKGYLINSTPLPFDSYTFDAQATVWKEGDAANPIEFVSLGICYDLEEAEQLGLAHAKQWVDTKAG